MNSISSIRLELSNLGYDFHKIKKFWMKNQYIGLICVVLSTQMVQIRGNFGKLSLGSINDSLWIKSFSIQNSIGRYLIRYQNMFLQYPFDVSHLLQLKDYSTFSETHCTTRDDPTGNTAPVELSYDPQESTGIQKVIKL
ncbi:hypothetical protein ACJX0J_035843 [Zea mays]